MEMVELLVLHVQKVNINNIHVVAFVIVVHLVKLLVVPIQEVVVLVKELIEHVQKVNIPLIINVILVLEVNTILNLEHLLQLV
jgi:hypothetical protein